MGVGHSSGKQDKKCETPRGCIISPLMSHHMSALSADPSYLQSLLSLRYLYQWNVTQMSEIL